jgi:WD40 repeat protein
MPYHGVGEKKDVPIQVIVEHIMPFLDRPSWNSCTLACKDIHQTSKDGGLFPQWPTIRIAQDHVKDVAFSPDGVYLAVGVLFPESNGQIQIYHVGRGLVQILRTERFNLELLEWPSQNYLICTDFYNIQVLAMQEDYSEIINTWNTREFQSIAADEGKLLAIGHCSGHVTVWSIPEGNHLSTLQQHSVSVKKLRFVPNNRLVSVCDRDLVCIWDLTDDNNQEGGGNPMCSEIITYALPVGIPPSGNHAAVASLDQLVYHTAHGSQIVEEISVWLWKINEEGVIPLYLSHVDSSNSHSLPITFLSFSDNGIRMASCSFDRTIRIWNIYTGECESVLEGHAHHTLKAYFAPDGKSLVSLSYDEFRLWNI